MLRGLGPNFADLEYVYVELTVKCNLRCHFCDNAMRNAYRDLPPERFREIVDQLPAGVRIGLHGLGEPTLYRPLLELIQYGKSRGHYIYFNSNHTVTSDEQMRAFVDLGLDELRISLCAGTRATYAEYAGVDLFDAVVERMRRMAELRGAGEKPLLRVVFVLTRQSWREYPEVLRLAEETGMDELMVQSLLDWGLADPGCALDDADAREARRLVEEASAASRLRVLLPVTEGGGPGQCQWPFNATWITADGHVTPCCNLHDPRRHVLGDAFREPLATIWTGKEYEGFRARYRAGTQPECQTCPVHHGRFKSYAYPTKAP